MATIRFLPRAALSALFQELQRHGHRCIGPRERDGVIQFGEIEEAGELPAGWGDEQRPGHYRLRRRDDRRLFAWANGPQAIKPHLFAPVEPLWKVERDEGGALRFEQILPEPEPVAIIGARPCDLAALAIQDRVFEDDPHYQVRRRHLFLVAIECSHPAETCFCHATGHGPGLEPECGADLALTELDDGYLIRPGSERGEALLEALPLLDAADEQFHQAGRQRLEAAARQRRHLPQGDLAGRLMARLDHPRWEEVAGRCLACGNCTMVCPTCFCHRQEEENAGSESTRRRLWDSCFTEGHSLLHGTPVRAATAARYRQWMTHKLATWQQQFGTEGCVGCGRCLTWCPAGIDFTEEAAAIAGEGP